MSNEIKEFDVITAGLAAIDDKFKHLTSLTNEELDALLLTVDGEKEIKAAKKELTTVRTSIGKLHKKAKQPILDAGRALDAKKKELEQEIRNREAPFADVIKRRDDAKEAQEAAALAARVAELEAALEANGITDPEFIPQSLELTVKGKEQLKALEVLLGKDILKALRFDNEGNGYILSINVARKELA